MLLTSSTRLKFYIAPIVYGIDYKQCLIEKGIITKLAQVIHQLGV